MDEAVCCEVVDLLKVRPELYDPLNTAIKIHEEKEMETGWDGFEWFELPAKPQTLKGLVLKKILKVNKKTRNRTFYQLFDLAAVKEALKITAILMMDENIHNSLAEDVPLDLFDDVMGYEDVKQLFFKSLFGEKEDKVHFLMVGPPASAKSLFLFCLEKLSASKYVLGSRTTKAGLGEYLISHQPRYLLVDEIDKMSGADYAILLSLCETGRVTEMVYGKTREVQLNTIVFASGNRLDGMPEEVISRFQALHFLPYSQTEFMRVVRHVLERRNMDPKLALYIGQQVSLVLGSRDVRQALRVAKLAKNRRQVDEIVRILSRYTKKK